jgi:hypothetical protein
MVFDRATDITTPSDFLPGQDILLHPAIAARTEAAVSRAFAPAS